MGKGGQKGKGKGRREEQDELVRTPELDRRYNAQPSATSLTQRQFILVLPVTIPQEDHCTY